MPMLKDGWKQWGPIFQASFLGTTANSEKCKLENKHVVHFYFFKKQNLLIAKADEPLVITNYALGYRIQFASLLFEADFNRGIHKYSGYAYFQNIDNKPSEKLLKARKLAYNGSLMHFIRSYYDGTCMIEGFSMIRTVKVNNEEKIRIKSILDKNFKDSSTYYSYVLRQPDTIQKQIPIFALNDYQIKYYGNNKMINISGKILIHYENRENAIVYDSQLYFNKDAQAMAVEKNGSIYPVNQFIMLGHWAFSENISNLLPYDYMP